MATASKEFIVAIELGSSKMTGIAGRKNSDGSINVLAVIKEDSSSFIKKGVIYNIDKTADSITRIISNLQTRLKTSISRVYVGVGGQSIRSVKNTITRKLDPGTKITEKMVIEVMDSNHAMSYPDQEIIDNAEQEYRVDNVYQTDPVGIQCSTFEGNFLNILERKTFYDTLNHCLETAKINIAGLYLAPLALADAVLTDSEKRSGCLLVDLGADTTTVLVYHKNILRHLAVIPLGGNNITADIASLKPMEESVAEEMKLKYASAYTEVDEIDPKLRYSYGTDIEVDSKDFIEAVEARLEEIIANVWNQVPQEYSGKLISGIILTGGGSNMKNIVRAFNVHTKVEKIRVATFINGVVTSKNDDVNAHDGKMNTVLGLLAKGDVNCAGKEIDPNDMFDANTTDKSHPTGRVARKLTEVPHGEIITKSERDKAAEEEQRRREEEEAERQRAAEEEREREQEERKKNRPINKLKKAWQSIVNTMTEPE